MIFTIITTTPVYLRIVTVSLHALCQRRTESQASGAMLKQQSFDMHHTAIKKQNCVTTEQEVVCVHAVALYPEPASRQCSVQKMLAGNVKWGMIAKVTVRNAVNSKLYHSVREEATA